MRWQPPTRQFDAALQIPGHQASAGTSDQQLGRGRMKGDGVACGRVAGQNDSLRANEIPNLKIRIASRAVVAFKGQVTTVRTESWHLGVEIGAGSQNLQLPGIEQ